MTKETRLSEQMLRILRSFDFEKLWHEEKRVKRDDFHAI